MDTTWHFLHYRLLAAQRQLLAGEQPVKLGSRAFDVLVALVERHERVVGKHELMDIVWPRTVVEENNLEVQIAALRKLLGHGAIATIPGRGYRFTLPLAGPADGAGEPLPAAPTPTPLHETNLSTRAVELVGRDAELQQLQRLIDGHPLVTVAGIGGIGKTRLAQAAAADRAAQQPVWWVELSPLSDPALVPQAVARAMGLALPPQGDATQAVLQALRGRSALLVLDNAEHLLDGVAAFVAALHGRDLGIKLLLTSQEVMRGFEEQVFRPGPLSLPVSDEGAAMNASGAVALFVARARLADPRFELKDSNRAAVAEICRRLDGIPLAIELAAARLGLLGVEGLRQRLDERFQVLTAGARAVLRRHQTLRAALDWSHGLLTPDEQRVFRRLGVFVGGFTLEAAQEVATDEQLDGWDLIERLGGLVDKSLVAAEGDPLPRYRLLETTRLYALERLAESGETDALLLRHARHALDLAEAFDRRAVRDGQTAEVLSALDAERDNLLHALDWCSRHEGAEAAAVGQQLAGALRYYWSARGLVGAGLAATQRALDSAASLPGDLHRCRALGSAAAMLQWLRRPTDAQARAAQLVALAEALDFDPGRSVGQMLLGYLSTHAGDWPAAQAHFEAVLAIARRMGNPHHEGNALVGLVDSLDWQGRRDEAWAQCQALVALRRSAGHAHTLAQALRRLAGLSLARGRIDEAEAALAEALPLVRAAGSRSLGLAWCGELARVAQRRGDPAAAVEVLTALAIHRQVDGLPRGDDERRLEDEALASARSALPDAEREAARAAGESLDEAAMLERGACWLQARQAG